MLSKQFDNSAVEKKSRKEYKSEKKAAAKGNAVPKEKPVLKEAKTSEKETRKQQKKQEKEEKRKNKKPRRRVLPIWFRIIIVLVLCAAALITGLMIGYGVIGDGNPTDALDPDTWQHIIDIVKKKE